MNQDGVHWPAPCAASCHAANAAFSLHAFCVPLAWHLILIEPSASCSIHRARDTYAASGSCLGRLRPEPVTCTMGFPVPAPFPASLPHPSHCATLPWLASSPNPRGWTACCGGFTAALQHTYAVFSLHPICKSRVNCNPLRANGLGMPTRPLDELDLSYTDEELRLLENWLVEHQGEWILDFGRKNWCFRGGGGAARSCRTAWRGGSPQFAPAIGSVNWPVRLWPSDYAARSRHLPKVTLRLRLLTASSPAADEPAAIQPITGHEVLPCGVALCSAAAPATSPHASPVQSPGTPSYTVAQCAAPPCHTSPFLADSLTAMHGNSSCRPSNAFISQRGANTSVGTSHADEQSSRVLDWLSGWARLASQTQIQVAASEAGPFPSLPAPQRRQRCRADLGVRASTQRRSMSAAPGPAICTHSARKRSRSCMVVPLPSVADLLAVHAPRSHR